MITYDEAKRQENIRKHGIDFAECEAVFDTPMVSDEDVSLPYGEVRYRSLALLSGRVVFMVWTEREGETRVISCRKGTRHETRRYFQEAAFR